MLEDALFTLLRIGLGVAEPQPSGFALSAEDWERLYSMAGEHSLMMLYAAPHHVDLAPGPDVEVHFEPSSR